MNYQQVLAISYIFNLMNQLINNPGQHISNNINYQEYAPAPAPAPAHLSNDNIEIVKLEHIFYIKDSKNNLLLIQDNMNNPKVKVLLNTFITFEKNKNNPMNIYLSLRNIKNPYPNSNSIDYELLKNLQMQYITNKSYFNNTINF